MCCNRATKPPILSTTDPLAKSEMGDTLRASNPRADGAKVASTGEPPQKLAAQPRKFDLLALPAKKEAGPSSRRLLVLFLFNPGRQDLIGLLLNSFPTRNLAYPSYYLGEGAANAGAAGSVSAGAAGSVSAGAGASAARPDSAGRASSSVRAGSAAGGAPSPGGPATARFRGDLIFLPPPTNDALEDRSNSIFSLLIQMPASSRNSVSSQTRRPHRSTAPFDDRADSATSAFWESLNLGGGLIAGLSNDNINAFLASLQTNGSASMDFTNMSNEQRRDSLLKFISDQGTASVRTLEPRGLQQPGAAREPQTLQPARLREDIFDHLRTRKPLGDHLLPTLSHSLRLSHRVADEPRLPRGSPVQPAVPSYVLTQALRKPLQSFYPLAADFDFSMGQYPSLKRNQYLQGENPGVFLRPALESRASYSYQPLGTLPNISSLLQGGVQPGIQPGIQQPLQPGLQGLLHPGLQQGLPQGLQQGLPQGLPQGLQQGIPQGLHQGLAQGLQPGFQPGLQSLQPNLQLGAQPGLQQGIQPSLQEGVQLSLPGLGDKPVLAQQHAHAEDGRPLLGATKVDQLMLVIQSRENGNKHAIQQAADGSIMAAENDRHGVLPQAVSLVGGVEKPQRDVDSVDDDAPEKKRKRRGKIQQCPYCLKQFHQSTHLDVHVRSHIGYKPFQCTFCLKRFTQGGNLRTHMRLHTGEKPFTCNECNRLFSRKGNLAAHMLTHKKEKPFECRLDNCDKSFTQLGNLKSHQNKFHLPTLNRLTQTLAELSGPELENLEPRQKELLDYFRKLYKNSNKGIRGRGKGKRVLQAGEGQLSPQGSPQQDSLVLLAPLDPSGTYEALRRDF